MKIILLILSIQFGFNTATNKVDHNYWADNSSSTSAPFTKYTPTDPLSVVDDSSLSHCHDLIVVAEGLSQNGQYQNAYDTYRSYIESCAYLSNSWQTFIDIGGMNTVRDTDLLRFEEYREWLKTVLYLNLDTNYYCADVNEILHTFRWFNNQRGNDYKGALAVAYFLVKTKRCGWQYIDTVNIPATWRACYSIWQDTVSNGPHPPFDSTLPTLEDLGLGILRGNPAEVKQFNDAVMGPEISNLRSLPNPFTEETKLYFTCRESMAVRFEIFDLLGKRVYDGGEKVYEQGENEIILSGDKLPHGLLYGRFITLDGTVKTIKLRRQ